MLDFNFDKMVNQYLHPQCQFLTAAMKWFRCVLKCEGPFKRNIYFNVKVNVLYIKVWHHWWCKHRCKQESPPAWMQEAYCPPCIEYSLCCPTWVPPLSWPGGGTMPGGVPDQGTPPAGYPLAGYPPAGYPLAGYPSPRQGTPPAGYPPSRVPPRLDLAGYPPGVCPMAFWEMLQSIMGYGYPPPPWKDRWKDRRVSKHYLPVALRTRAVKMSSHSLQPYCPWIRLPLVCVQEKWMSGRMPLVGSYGLLL